MSKIELIKAEIERRIAGNSDARARVLSEILTFINSLPEDESSENIGQLNSEDLEKAAEEYENSLDYYECINQWPSVGFKAGAQWQKEKMMKDAVEGFCFVSPIAPSPLFVQTEHFANNKGFRHGETCKAIIVKED